MTLLQVGIGVVIGVSIAIFLTVTLLLVWVLLFARKKLMPQGKVKITINDEKSLRQIRVPHYYQHCRRIRFLFRQHVVVVVHVVCARYRLTQAADPYYPQKRGSLPERSK